MDWMTGMQKAIDYMEDHITQPLDYKAIAKQAYTSGFYFQRVFSILCGFTVGEYIRSRRLTLAGQELLASDTKIIDLALKYGYETPESFTRAFTRFHGVSPSAARSKPVRLKSFARLSIHLSLKGGETMNYKIEQKEAFQLVSKSIRLSGENAVKQEVIPNFWKQCHEDGSLNWLGSQLSPDGVLGKNIVGACIQESATPEDFQYSVGAEYSSGEKIPDGFTVTEIPAQTWAVFDATGTMPNAIWQLWHKIFSEFFPSSEYQPKGTCDLELYPSPNTEDPNYHSEVWVAVEKKKA